ncbi:cyanophycinase [Amaricoccus solimangrovi]|uniref:Cyanophycinase n=1 Tax=Amaricoccus solimangrovi TaxID=2589815 RepID=A0A501X0D8_9RHOB|nr:cyanophycinase [Amaricoccus solimangrovi]TPE52116.1 cyanophycinase [Amaricoccus solimangrovi]
MAPWSVLAERAAAAGGKRLAVIGGRLEDDNVAVYGEMHRLSGGRILVFPTASGEPAEVGAETRNAFLSHGFEVEVCDLHEGNAARAAFDPGIIEKIAAFGSVYFTGGDQAKIVDALLRDGAETPVLAAIRAAHGRGGLVAGSSAGAAMMSGPMILGGTSLESVVHGLTSDPEAPGLLMGTGLGFFGFGMVDQHFIKRGRLGRLIVGMQSAGARWGFGIDENTALLVEGDVARVRGEYGVMLVDLRRRKTDAEGRAVQEFRLSYVDDGDWIDLRKLRGHPGAAKRRVRKRELAYRAPANSRRNVFGAYALYDLMARLVLGDPAHYTEDRGEALDVRTGINAAVTLEKPPRLSRGLIATPETGLRMTALNFRAELVREHLSEARAADRAGRRGWSAESVNPGAPLILLGSSPLGEGGGDLLRAVRDLVGNGEIGVIAAASAEPARTAADHLRALERAGLRGIDLGVTIDTVEYVSADPDQLNRIAELDAVLLCGGNQIRLVETMLHRGEESGVLRAIARAHARGAALIAPSGAAAALSSVMIAGGSSEEALRYGVTSDLGHPGLVIQEGIGFLGAGIVDQNLISSGRLGRLVVACAEENERFGIGVCEESAVVATANGARLEARGRHGFVLVDTAASALELQSDSFVAKDIRLTVVGPGDVADLATGEVIRAIPCAASPTLLERLAANLARDVDSRGARGARVRLHSRGTLSAVLDLESPRDEYDA